jgi:putative tryptophan/tyrosine transport system substrate-binding protein
MEEIDRTIEKAGKLKDGGIIIPTDSYTRTRGERIATLALKSRVPIIAAFSEFPGYGGLTYYGSAANENMVLQYRQAASYVDRILKGAKPGDLPVQLQPNSLFTSTQLLRHLF